METYALITGASAGIGRAVARELARRGIHLLLVALPDSGLETMCDELANDFGIRCHAFTGDLTEPDTAERIEAWCRSGRFRVQYLINNAGFGNQNPLELSDIRLLVNMMNLNNQAMVRMTQLFIPHLKKHHVSRLMNVGSLASFLPIPNKSVYVATKSFVYAFSASLRTELYTEGIRVSCLCPGPTVTNTLNNERAQNVWGSQLFLQPPEVVATEAVAGMLAGKRRIIPGFSGKFLFGLYRVMPTHAVDWILAQLFTRSVRGKRATLQVYTSHTKLLALAFR
jgi:hypothetical protein